MRTPILIAAAASLSLALAVWIAPKALAQQFDVVHLDTPYAVTIGEKILPPGNYVIEQQRSPDSTVLLFYSADGMKFQTSAMTMTIYGNTDDNPPKDTSVVLQHIGDAYYFNKMSIQGKAYGYELALPKSAKSQEKRSLAQAVTVRVSSSAREYK